MYYLLRILFFIIKQTTKIVFRFENNAVNIFFLSHVTTLSKLFKYFLLTKRNNTIINAEENLTHLSVSPPHYTVCCPQLEILYLRSAVRCFTVVIACELAAYPA